VRRLGFSRRAEHDLREILDYLAAENPVLAIRMIDQLETAALELGSKALNYQRLSFVTEGDVRRRVVGAYNIVYSVTSERVEILVIAHGARDLERLLNPDD
jgi:plasmid stabilization system protein ParE